MRVVVDTNVLASGVIRRNPASGVVQIIDCWRAGDFDLIISNHIVTELIRTLAEPYFRRHITADRATRFVELLHSHAFLTPITATVRGVATHPEDDLVLATAVSARVDYLVTGDTKLRKLGTYEGVGIVSPREFLEGLATPGTE